MLTDMLHQSLSIQLLAHEIIAGYSGIGSLSRQLLPHSCNAEAITIGIFKKKSAGGHASPGASFDLQIASAPEELAITIGNIRIILGFIEGFRL